MSSRQRARLAASLRAERGEAAVAANSEDEHSEGSDHELQADLRPAQPSYGLLWPESSDSDSDAAEGNTSPVAKTVHAAPAHAPRNTSSKKKKKKKLVDKSSKCEQANQADMLIADEIDAAIEELELSAEPPSAAANGARSSQIAQILAVDPQGLDVDSLIRQRFAGAAADTGTDRGAGKRGARQGNAKQHVHRLGGVGRFIFGMPKDEWLKPPSYVGGGVGMAPSRPSETMGTGDPALGSRLRGSKMFQFIWADEYAIVNDQFRAIQQSGDANRLVTFLAQHHYHLEGLLQLAMVFARTGHMDRASDLVRRCLFCMHCAEAEAFRPCTATVLLDPAVYENRIYFAAVFRHMQIVGMLGCPSVAANIAKLLLSLNPFGDTAHVLLCIDYYLIAAGDASEFENLYEHAEHIIVGIDTSEKRDASESSKRPDCTRLNLTDLPNWLFSSALNAFLRSRRCGVYSKYEDSENDLKYKALSDFRLRSAIIKYPFFLHYLLPSNAISGGVGGSAVVGTASSVILPAQWKRLLSNSFFLPLPVSQSFSVLAHLGDIYRARSSTLWANRKAGGGGDFVDVEKWIYEIAVDVLREQESEYDQKLQLGLWEELCSRTELRKYLSADLDDFMEEFPRLPPDANPLDPQFADPRALLPVARGADGAALRVADVAGQRRPNHNRRLVNRNDEFGAEDEEAHIMRQLAQFEAQEGEMLDQLMRQEQEIGLLNQYENANREPRISLLRRISNLPKPLKEFLCNILEQRVKQSRHIDVDGDAADFDMDSFVDEESLLAEVAVIRSIDSDVSSRTVNDGELRAIISEVLRRSPDDIFAEYSAQTEDAISLDLDQPLMQLFLRSFLPWNALDPAAMRR